MKYAVLFDMDGVLVNSEPVIEAAAIKGLKEYGVPAKPEDFLPFVGTGEDRYIGGVAEKYGVKYIPEMKKRVYEIYLEIVQDELKLYDSVKPVLDFLKSGGHKMAVASSADRIKINANLKVAGISPENFMAVVSGEDVVHKKPSPDIYLKAAGLIGAHPSECVVIEDAVNGIQAAKAAGMKCIALTTSFPEDVLKKEAPDFICSDISEIMALPLLK